MKEETASWLKKAEVDLASAKALFDLALWDTCCYHCQQCSEKLLKGLLAESETEILKTHELNKLFELVKISGIVLPEEVRLRCENLSGLDTVFRYPGVDAIKEDAVGAMEDVLIVYRAIIQHVDSTLK
jgi:HEPN domain-containing protein